MKSVSEISDFIFSNEDWPENAASAVPDIRGLLNARDLDYCRQRLLNMDIPHGPVLEMGCGSGRWSYALSADYPKVKGIDLHEPRVRLAQFVADSLNLKHVEFDVQSVTDVSDPDESYAGIVCYSVLIANHLLPECLTEMYRLLKPGGVAYVNLNGMGWNYYLRDELSQSNPATDAMGRQGIFSTLVRKHLASYLDYLNTLSGSERSPLLAAIRRDAGESRGVEDDEVAILKALYAQSSATFTDTMPFEDIYDKIERDSGNEYARMLLQDLVNISTGAATDFSYRNAPTGYDPQWAQRVAESIGFTGFEWKHEGLFEVGNNAQALDPIFPDSTRDGDLTVWDFRLVKPGPPLPSVNMTGSFETDATDAQPETTAHADQPSTPGQETTNETPSLLGKLKAAVTGASARANATPGTVSEPADTGSNTAEPAQPENISENIEETPSDIKASTDRILIEGEPWTIEAEHRFSRVAQPLELRRYPKPYKAALAINNDVDGMSIEAFNDWHDYVNGTDPTAYGDGLGLEVGDAFWIWCPYRNLSLCHQNPDEDPVLSDHAPRIIEMHQAGYLDSLHSLGSWVNGWEIPRDYTKKSLDFLDSLGLKPQIWSDHGAGNHFTHSIGGHWPTYEQGDNPEHHSYCADLLKDFGIEFFWGARMFELQKFGEYQKFPSQAHLDQALANYNCAHLNMVPDLDGGPAITAIPEADREKWRRKYFNRILIEDTLRDGSKIHWFKRFRGLNGPNAGNFVEQVNAPNLDHLEKTEGAVVVYQHFGYWRALGMPMGHKSGRDSQVPVLDEHAQWAFRELADRYHAGRIWVATSYRLLRYLKVRDYLKFEVEHEGANLVIKILYVDCPVDGQFIPSASDLMGLTFQLPKSTAFESIKVVSQSSTEFKQFRVEDAGDNWDVTFDWEPLTYIPSSQSS